MLLPPGVYKMRVTAVDVITKRTGLATFGLEVKDFSSDQLQLSDIEFAYDIIPVEDQETKSSLIKANRIVHPNPNRYISNEDSLLYIYCEVYNLTPPSAEPEQFDLRSSLHDKFGFQIREFPTQQLDKPGTSAVVTRGIPIYGVPGGEYELRLTVKDRASGTEAVASKGFMMIYSFDQLAPTMSREDAFSQEDAELMQKVIRYISSKEEKDTYEQLDLEGKQAFLAQFWERKNPNPGSGINAYKNDVFRRFAYANENFSTSVADKSDGWRTDRGRIYIMYGNPDDIDRSPFSMGVKPYELWHYFRLAGQRGGDYCLFVDEDGYGNYRIVSSTIRGEISDPEWDYVVQNGLLGQEEPPLQTGPLRR
jgi:GWxTD domain-containing protein